MVYIHLSRLSRLTYNNTVADGGFGPMVLEQSPTKSKRLCCDTMLQMWMMLQSVLNAITQVIQVQFCVEFGQNDAVSWGYNGPWPAVLISSSSSPNTCFVWKILSKHSCDIIFSMLLVWAGKKVGIKRPLSVLWLHKRFLNIPNKELSKYIMHMFITRSCEVVLSNGPQHCNHMLLPLGEPRCNM